MIKKKKKLRNGLDENPCYVTVFGEPASKANQRRAVLIHGKPRFIKSKKALSYSKNLVEQLSIRESLLEGDLCVAIKIYYKTRRPDLDESLILDLLQDKLYKNDRQVKRKYIEHGLDKNNPRSIIVCGPIESSDDVIAKLKELCEIEDQKSQS
jgi:Holliday junction resolvase RusA-like endonuclease|tara:strand:+ start:423 stop:881 length:459 start_codon:yes stop_codon:yes gene_type:complete